MLIKAAVSLLTGRSSLENPSTPLTASNINDILGSGLNASSGEKVNSDTVLTHPVLFRGVNLVSGDVAKLPVFVYRRLENENREADKRHPASVLLRRRASQFMTAHTFIRTMIGHAMLHRGGYAWIRRNGRGQPSSMEILNPRETFPVIVQTSRDEESLVYMTRDRQGREMTLLAENVFHIKGLGGDGIDGYSVIDRLKEAIGLGLATQRYAAVFFANNAQPRVVIKFPGHLRDDAAIQRFRAGWQNVHGGSAANAHKPAILEGGAELQQFSLSNEDAQFIETQNLNIRLLSVVIGVPPHKLGDDTRTSHASLEQENQSYLDESLDPWLRAFETESNEKLLTSEQNVSESHFVEFVRSAFVRTNMKDRFEGYQKAILAGFMSRAQARRLENWNVDDPDLEEFLEPLNMVPAGSQDTPAEDEPEPEPEDETTEENQAAPRNAVAETVLRMTTESIVSTLLQRLCKRAETAAGKPDRFVQWVDCDLYQKNVSMFERDLSHYPNQALITSQVFDKVQARLLETNRRVRPQQLAEAVTQAMTELRADLVPQITTRLLEGVCHGQTISA